MTERIAYNECAKLEYSLTRVYNNNNENLSISPRQYKASKWVMSARACFSPNFPENWLTPSSHYSTGATLQRLRNSCRVLVLWVRPHYVSPSRISMRIVADAVILTSRCCTQSVERFTLASVHFYDRASKRASLHWSLGLYESSFYSTSTLSSFLLSEYSADTESDC